MAAEGKESMTDSTSNEENQDSPAGTVISPDKMKAIFDKMTEIETNPNSRTAREFEAKMMELEKKNVNKRQG